MKIKKEIFEAPSDKQEGVRINKYLADAGVCSRRQGDKAIEDGDVTIDGVTAVMGSRVFPGQEVTYMGKVVSKVEDLILIAFNKPLGVVSTTDRRDPDNIIDYINYGKRIFPIGRLDKNSDGLILLTNDGDIVNKILRAGNYHEKEYIVTVNKDITPDFLHAMSGGVPILDGKVTRPCTVEQIDRFTFRIILTQGLNRQIRRMCEALNYRVRSLTRIRIMNINLGHLKTGTYRNLTETELAGLRDLIASSSNAPFSASDDFEDEDTVQSTGGRRSENDRRRTRKTGDMSRCDDRKAGDDSRRKNNRQNDDNRRKNNRKNNDDRHKFSKRNTFDTDYNSRSEKGQNHSPDRASLKGGKGLRAGRPGNYQ